MSTPDERFADRVLDRCPSCGYDRSGLEAGAVCPECGGEEPVLPRSTVCIACGYSLVGLPNGSVCPECRTPADESRPGGMLVLRPAVYLDRLRRGAMFAHVGILIAVASVICLIGLAFGGAYFFAALPIPLGILIAIVALVGTLGASGVSLFGWWRLTEPDPEPDGWAARNAPGEGYRKTVRVVIVAEVVITVLSIVAGIVEQAVYASGGGTTPFTGPTAGVVVLMVTQFGLGILWFGAFLTRFIAGVLYISELGRRMADAKLMKRAKRQAWLCPLIAVVGVVACYLGPLIALVLYYNLLVDTRKAMRRVMELRPAGV